jgi:hypothetical protein
MRAISKTGQRARHRSGDSMTADFTGAFFISVIVATKSLASLHIRIAIALIVGALIFACVIMH